MKINWRRLGKILEGYSRLIYYIKENRAQGMSQENSVDAAINRNARHRLDGLQEGLLNGGIITLILDNLEEGISKERIISKLMKRFHLTKEEACNYYMQTTKDL